MKHIVFVTLFLWFVLQSIAANLLFAASPVAISMGCDDANGIQLNKTINIDNGLSHNGVTSMCKDSRGYFWIGTYDGLNRYDGYSVDRIKNSVRKKLLPSNRIRSIREDVYGRLWLGTDRGVVLYDYEAESFTTLDSEPDQQTENSIIRSIYFAQHDSVAVCLSEKDGVFLYNKDGLMLRHDVMPSNYIFRNACQLDDSHFFIVYSQGLYLYDCDRGVFSQCVLARYMNVFDVALLGHNEMLIACNDKIVRAAFQVQTDGVCKLEFKGNLPCPIDKRINSVFVDQSQGLWIGTLDLGFYYLPDFEHHSQTFAHDLDFVRINSFLEDGVGNYWISTFDHGIYNYQLRHDTYRTINTKNARWPHFIGYDRDRVLMFSTNGFVSLFNIPQGSYEPLPFAIDKEKLSQPKFVLKDSKQNLWMMGNSKNWVLVNAQQQVTYLTDPKLSLLKDEVPYCAVEDYFGNLWLGYNGNLYRVSKNDENQILTVESVHQNPIFDNRGISKVKCLYSDSLTHTLWVGTDVQGLYQIHLSRGAQVKHLTIEHYENEVGDATSLSSNFVSAIMRVDGTLWVGTEQGGLCQTIETSQGVSFKVFSEKDGLSNNVVKSIVADGDHHLWVATNNALNQFNRSNNYFRKFRKADGFPFEEFWYFSYAHTDGSLFFTSATNEFCYFNPTKLQESESMPSIQFSALKIFGEQVQLNAPFNGRVILTRHLHNGGSLDLCYDENVFTIQVDVLYNRPSTNHYYRYKLEGLSNQWIVKPVNDQMISFNGLQPDRYVLRVEASDSYGNWSPAQVICIRVNPPFWKTVWAYLFYALIALALVGCGVWVLMRIQRLSFQLRIEELKKLNLIEMNAEKQRFFSNVSHELRTPLTLICAPLELLSDRFSLDNDVREKLSIIKRQSRKMLQLIDLSLNIAKNDAGLMKLQKTSFVFNDLVDEVMGDFFFMAKYDHKNLEVRAPQSRLSVMADRDVLEKVINNLLSNAFKHTRVDDMVTLTYDSEGSNLVLKIADTGYGISEPELPHIFDRFFQATQKDAHKAGGTGIGLAFVKQVVTMSGGQITVHSQLSQGTEFVITLPVVEAVEPLQVVPVQTEAQVAPAEVSKPAEKLPVIGEFDTKGLEFESHFPDAMVYIVDDDVEMRLLLANIMDKYYQVKVFSNGRDCLTAMQTEWPDIVLSDVMMPEMDGNELCRTIKNDIKTSHIPVVLLTARTTVDERIEGLTSGADAYISKPFYTKHLLVQVEKLLENRKQLRERFLVGIPLVQKGEHANASKDNDFMQKLYEVFAQNLSNEELVMDDVAREVGMSKSMFFLKIKALTDGTPYDLLKKYRLKKAAEFLEQGDMNVNEVCINTGFKSRTHFCRLFKETYNVSPSKYAKTLQDGAHEHTDE